MTSEKVKGLKAEFEQRFHAVNREIQELTDKIKEAERRREQLRGAVFGLEELLNRIASEAAAKPGKEL